MTQSRKPWHLIRPLLLFGLLAAFVNGWAQSDRDFPPRPNPPRLVNDLANVLPAAQEQELEQKLVQYDRESSTQITIVTVRSLGSYEIAQYATELGNRWGVGRKGKDNGVVIIAAIDDRRINISPGYGLEGVLPDVTCGRIIDNEIKPAFKQSDYYTGFSKAADAIIAATKGEYVNEDPDDGEMEEGQKTILGVTLMIIFIALIVFASRSKHAIDMRPNRRSSGSGMWFGPGGGWGGGSSSGGGGGFGGFGGGSFGGGGASGSW